MDILNCNWDQARFFIFSGNVYNPLVYYSHFITLFASVFVGLTVFFKDRKNPKNIFLFLMTMALSVWIIFNLILWGNEKKEMIMFFWSTINMIEYLIFVFGFFLMIYYLKLNNNITLYLSIFFVLFIPFILFLHTDNHLAAFDFSNCDREVINSYLVYYLYIFEFVFYILITIKSILFLKNKENKEDKEFTKNLIFIGSINLFFLLFVIDDVLMIMQKGWLFEQYKLFGSIIFLGIMVILIVNYSFFKVKIFATQVFVWILFILAVTRYFSSTDFMGKVINVVMLIFIVVFGLMLINAFRKLERQKNFLQISNNEQAVLLHFITHQVKGFFTKSKYIFSMMKDEEYGKLPDYLVPLVEEGIKSDQNGISLVMSVLNASKLKQGHIASFEEKIDFVKIVNEIVKSFEPIALKKGLKYNYDLPKKSLPYFADKFQITNVFKNLIDNSIQYTEKGEIDIDFKIEKDTILFHIKDTGIGINSQDKEVLFQPGGRGKDSIKFNVNSTGYGLFVAKKIIEHYKGNIFCASDGQNKGTAFTVILPVENNKN